MNLHKHPEEFRAAILGAAKKYSIQEHMIEKDYWITVLLYNLSKSSFVDKVVFKGGTSLSKVHKITRRFSEDCDFALKAEAQSANQIKNLIAKIEKTIASAPFKEVKDHLLISKGSKFRKSVHSYPRLLDGELPGILDVIVLEINSFANPFPHDRMIVSSFIGDYIKDYNPTLLTEYGISDFSVNVLDLRRTFVEKILALVRASYQGDSDLSELRNKIRHIYDIARLMETKNILEFMDSDDFFKMIDDARNDDSKNSEFQGDWSKRPLGESEIFKNMKAALHKLESTYNDSFERTPPIMSYEKPLSLIGKRLNKYDDYKKNI
ncbi:MAG: nucleotidyl transferase AbiEii/AbiGii toxin family protein [Oligoflexia bacterium]|nr:nucleotidyl transferase AbiEii/AbiGii toxin family protein [Oligoflexia bacterium]